ncbi:MAG: hypothetical protein OZSIB_3541 [Candidatus Ozemobacter sibiricus]|jgi:uncharacterized protein (TIRG00374 family)|uniref:Dolichol-P-glucose synthetase n=1 Tax=Candidatus Ozemobacter sibiricus TaxID=2268124 RepID=A0A367ZQC5_9BACT|nr:MAG: hypothetical protein OZSIB_3541 [Candidatus Ozemobacter sibiricus]
MFRSKRFWGLVVSLVFLWLALRRVEWQRLPPILLTIDPRFVAAMLVSIICEGLMRAWRWQVILGGRPLPFRHSYTGLMLGYFFNNVLPARAGEFIRAAYLGRQGIIRSSEAFGSVVLERFVDGIAVLTLILLAVQWFEVSPGIRQAGFSALVFYALVLGFILLFQFRRHWVMPITGFFIRLLPERFRERVTTAQEAFIRGLDSIRHPGRFLGVIALTFLSWGISTFTYYLSLKVFGLSQGWDVALLLISILSLGAMIPSSPGMIGIYQWCCMLVLSDMLHLPPEVAASHGLFTHFISYSVVLVIGLGLLTLENLSINDLQNAAPLDPA